ncbi:MAG: hypothetical protein ACRDHY_17845, partial [Anaerolineales bacterium]
AGERAGGPPEPARPAEPPKPRRFFGTVKLDPSRVGRDAGQIAEAVVQHLVLLPKAKVDVTLEVRAEVPDGAPDREVRVVSENCRTLKFEVFGFEEG